MHLSGLHRTAKALLAEICRYVPQSRPFDTVFAHKKAIAKRLDAAESTVYRHMKALVENALVEVLPQERKSRNGKYAVARIRLTRKAAEILGFIEPEFEVFHSPPTPEIGDGQTLTEPTISTIQPARSTAGIPADLACLASSGMSRPGIFKLMGKATAKGKRLSDVVTVAASHIAPIKGGRLYSYLAKLVDGASCFKVAAANERRRIAEAREQDRQRQKAHTFRERFAGTTLTDRKQTRLFLIDERARFVQTIAPGFNGTQPLNDLTEWIKGIESGQLVLATLATERRLQAAA